jgi:hypothetical protein
VQSRNLILGAALAFIAILAGLTVVVAVRNGPDVLTVASLLVLAMFAFGIVGALRHPPHE